MNSIVTPSRSRGTDKNEHSDGFSERLRQRTWNKIFTVRRGNPGLRVRYPKIHRKRLLRAEAHRIITRMSEHDSRADVIVGSRETDDE